MAWLDADIAMAQNIFTLISRWYDFGATWSGGGQAPLPFMQSLLGFPLKVRYQTCVMYNWRMPYATKPSHPRQVVRLSLVPYSPCAAYVSVLGSSLTCSSPVVPFNA